MKLISETELKSLERTLELCQEELDAVDIDTNWVLTTGAPEAIEEALELIDELQKQKDA